MLFVVARNKEERNAHRTLFGKLAIKSYLEELGVEGRMTMKWILMKWNRGKKNVDWTHLLTMGKEWLDVVSTVMNLWIP
jgi:hypothetical protein